MNGPQHYHEAEFQLQEVSDKTLPVEVSKARIAKAQAHATLALVALLTETQIGPESSWDLIRHEWSQAVRKS